MKTKKYMKTKISVDKCYLIYDEDGNLVCAFNHKMGEECLAHKCKYCGQINCVCFNLPLTNK